MKKCLQDEFFQYFLLDFSCQNNVSTCKMQSTIQLFLICNSPSKCLRHIMASKSKQNIVEHWTLFYFSKYLQIFFKRNFSCSSFYYKRSFSNSAKMSRVIFESFLLFSLFRSSFSKFYLHLLLFF